MEKALDFLSDLQESAGRFDGAVRTNWAELVDWQLGQKDDAPLYERLCALLREQIVTGMLPAGSRLPSTRQLMNRLGVSRTTVITAYAQLHSDGYVVCRVGSGTYVADSVRDKIGEAADAGAIELSSWSRPQNNGLSDRGQRYHEMDLDTLSLPNVPFNTGVVRIDSRTAAQWQRLVRHGLAVDSLFQGYCDPQGSEALRKEVARYVGVSRGVRCTEDQVILVAGSQQGIDLAIKVLLDPGAKVWVEDPGYPLTRVSLATAGMALHYVPVDDEGLRVGDGIANCPDARAAFITPSHQYPLGVSLSIERRMQLLEWATRRRAWIIEDDYDSEFRYNGTTLPALQGLDRSECVVYIGTFSKVLQPAIRYGYVIVPKSLVKAFKVARFLADRHSPVFFENVLTEFIEQGYFVSHIRRMRAQYSEARDILVELLSSRLGRWLDVQRPNQGLHLIAYLKHGLDDTRVAQEARKVGVVVRPISRLYALGGRPRSGLMLGFAGFTPSRMDTAVNRLAEVLERFTVSRELS